MLASTASTGVFGVFSVYLVHGHGLVIVLGSSSPTFSLPLPKNEEVVRSFNSLWWQAGSLSLAVAAASCSQNYEPIDRLNGFCTVGYRLA